MSDKRVAHHYSHPTERDSLPMSEMRAEHLLTTISKGVAELNCRARETDIARGVDRLYREANEKLVGELQAVLRLVLCPDVVPGSGAEGKARAITDALKLKAEDFLASKGQSETRS